MLRRIKALIADYWRWTGRTDRENGLHGSARRVGEPPEQDPIDEAVAEMRDISRFMREQASHIDDLEAALQEACAMFSGKERIVCAEQVERWQSVLDRPAPTGGEGGEGEKP